MGLPTPYYEDGHVTIYHGNCRELAALLYAKLTGRRGVGIDVRESECEKAARRLSGILPGMLPATSVMDVRDLDEAA